MPKTFFFYDLETSGLSSRDDRIMQFAGQRTSSDFVNIGEPVNILIKLNDDTLPSPDALMVTGITPQKTVEEGYSEAEFARILIQEIFTPDTIIVGYNNIRFDDEFIRYFLWRNFYDPYEWAYSEGRSRWDLLDVVRMTRALRPEGINWPVTDDGKPTNRLELLSKLNGIDHQNAHDALSDVYALIGVAKLISDKQPQLFKFLLDLRDKKQVQKIVNLDNKTPFVYASGRYDGDWNKTTVALPLAPAPNKNVLVYDLRINPEYFVSLTESELKKLFFAPYEDRKKEDYKSIPVKVLQYNRCPAIAPIGVLEANDGWAKVGLNLEIIKKHIDILLKYPDFTERIRTLFEIDKEYPASPDPEAQLYDGFLPDIERMRTEAVRNANEQELVDLHPEFNDERLSPLLLHYKGRNFPNSLSQSEQKDYELWRSSRLARQAPSVLSAIKRLSSINGVDEYILQEIMLWVESVVPSEIN